MQLCLYYLAYFYGQAGEMMTIENIRIVIRLMQILIPVFAFVFVMIVAESYHPGKHIVRKGKQAVKGSKKRSLGL